MTGDFDIFGFAEGDEEDFLDLEALFAQQQAQLAKDPLGIAHHFTPEGMLKLPDYGYTDPTVLNPKTLASQAQGIEQSVQAPFFKKPLSSNPLQFVDLSDTMGDGNIEFALDADGDQHSAELVLRLELDKAQPSQLTLKARHASQTAFDTLGSFAHGSIDPNSIYIGSIEHSDGIKNTLIKFKNTAQDWKKTMEVRPPDEGSQEYQIYVGKQTFRYDAKGKVTPNQSTEYQRQKTIEVLRPPAHLGVFWETWLAVGGFGDWVKLRMRPKQDSSDPSLVEIYVTYYHGKSGIYRHTPVLLDLGGKSATYMQVEVVQEDLHQVGLKLHPEHTGATLKISHSLQALHNRDMHHDLKQDEALLRNPERFAIGRVHFNFYNKTQGLDQSYIKYKGKMETHQTIASAELTKEHSKRTKGGAKSSKSRYVPTSVFKLKSSLDATQQIAEIKIPSDVQQEIDEMDMTRTMVVMQTALEHQLIDREKLATWINFSRLFFKLLHTDKATLMQTDSPYQVWSKQVREVADLAQDFIDAYSLEIGRQDLIHSQQQVHTSSQGTVVINQFANPYFTGETVTETSVSGPYFKQKEVTPVPAHTRPQQDHPASFDNAKGRGKHHGDVLSSRRYAESEVHFLTHYIETQNWAKARKAYAALREGYENWAIARIRLKMKMVRKNDPQFKKFQSLVHTVEGIRTHHQRLAAQKAKRKEKNIKKVQAVFYEYPHAQATQDLPNAIKLNMYYYANHAKKQWWVMNLTSFQGTFEKPLNFSECADRHRPDKVDGALPPPQLFDLLKKDKTFPKGMFYYQVPGGVGGEVEITGSNFSTYDTADWIKVGGVLLSFGALLIPGGTALALGFRALSTAKTLAVMKRAHQVSSILGGVGTAAVGVQGAMKIYNNDSHDAMTYAGGVFDVAASLFGILASINKFDDFLRAKGLQDPKMAGRYIAFRNVTLGLDIGSFTLTTIGTAQKLKAMVDSKVPPEEKWADFMWEVFYLVVQGTLTGNNLVSTQINNREFRAHLALRQRRQAFKQRRSDRRAQGKAAHEYQEETERKVKAYKRLHRLRERKAVREGVPKAKARQERTKENRQRKEKSWNNKDARRQEIALNRKKNFKKKQDRVTPERRERLETNAKIAWEKLQAQYFGRSQRIKVNDPKNHVFVVDGKQASIKTGDNGGIKRNESSGIKRKNSSGVKRNNNNEIKRNENSGTKKKIPKNLVAVGNHTTLSLSEKRLLAARGHQDMIVKYQGELYPVGLDVNKGWFFKYEGKVIYLQPHHHNISYNPKSGRYDVEVGGKKYVVKQASGKGTFKKGDWFYMKQGKSYRVSAKRMRTIQKKAHIARQTTLHGIDIHRSFNGKSVMLSERGKPYYWVGDKKRHIPAKDYKHIELHVSLKPAHK